jgi:hypothetical protein
MTHPEELLAPYVDGTASPEERAAVDAHASTCARCRAEIEAAAAARAALKRLPVVEAPPGLAPDPVATPAAARPSGAPGWYRWGGAAAAAAVIALLLVMVLPKSGNNSSTDAAGSNGKTATEATAPVALEIQDRDFGGAALKQELTTATAGAAPTAPSASGPSGVDTANTEMTGTPKDAKDAQACLTTAFGEVPGTLVRLISARYDGKPAYIGIYRQEAGAGQLNPYLVARAATAGSCHILTVVLARLDT